MPHRGRTGINIFQAEYVATLSADTPGTLCDLHLLLLTGCGNAMWARQSFTGLHIWNRRTTCAGYSTGRPAICESFNVRGFGGRTLDSPTFHVYHLRFLGNDARTRHGARCVSAHRGRAGEKSDFFSMQPHEASGLCQEPVMHPPFNISILHQFHLVPSVALFQEHHRGSPL